MKTRAPALTLTAIIVAATALFGCGSDKRASSQQANATPSTAASEGLAITSTLDGHKTVPHRIHWIAKPNVPSGQVLEVDFLIDGKSLWTEENAPYYYGGDGNYLVTSFLKPGTHRFTVKARTTTGRAASDSVDAHVPSPPAVPSGLAGTWKGFVKQKAPDAPPSGYWRLVINPVGWGIYDTAGGGNRLDVAYPAPGLVEVRTGMATGHQGRDLNGWCNDAPGAPVRYRYSINGANLQFTYAGGHACPGFTRFLTGLGTPTARSWQRS